MVETVGTYSNQYTRSTINPRWSSVISTTQKMKFQNQHSTTILRTEEFVQFRVTRKSDGKVVIKSKINCVFPHRSKLPM